MPTFGELLIKYTERAGISDAELARTTGVQRQTIFRWKEGLVARPRYREDVLRIAAKLRLTAEERDELLLAGGFPPENLGRCPRSPDEEGGVPDRGVARHGRRRAGEMPAVGAVAGPPAGAPHAGARGVFSIDLRRFCRNR